MKKRGVRYVVDSSSFIESWQRDHPPKSFPSWWEKVEELIQTGALRAPEEVYRELERINDELAAWAKKQSGLFLPIDEAQQERVTHILANYPRLVDNRRRGLAADPWVIAVAAVHSDSIVITDEREAPSSKSPKIPDVCRALKVDFGPFARVAEEESWTF